MTTPPRLSPNRPSPPDEQLVDLLMQALQSALPVALLDLWLDRIEASR